MKKPELISFKLIIYCAAFIFIACNADLHEVSGKVAMVGHEPFTYLTIKGENKTEYRIVGPLTEMLAKKYQGRNITLEGKIIKKAIGPGFPAEFAAIQIKE